MLPGSKKVIHQLLRKLICAPPGWICSLPAPTNIGGRNRNPPDYAAGLFETPATAHLGRARRTGDRQWVAEDNNGQPVAIIRRGDPTLPAVFRCEPTPRRALRGHCGSRIPFLGAELRAEKLQPRRGEILFLCPEPRVRTEHSTSPSLTCCLASEYLA